MSDTSPHLQKMILFLPSSSVYEQSKTFCICILKNYCFENRVEFLYIYSWKRVLKESVHFVYWFWLSLDFGSQLYYYWFNQQDPFYKKFNTQPSGLALEVEHKKGWFSNCKIITCLFLFVVFTDGTELKLTGMEQNLFCNRSYDWLVSLIWNIV